MVTFRPIKLYLEEAEAAIIFMTEVHMQMKLKFLLNGFGLMMMEISI